MPISLNGDGIVSGVTTFTTAVTGVTTFSSVVIGSGSTAAPAISPSGDSNTGIFFPAADTIAFGEGGAEALRITSTAQLQATGASDVRLTLGSSGTAGTNDSNHIRGDGTSLKFMNASGGVTIFENNGTERFRITNNGVTFNGDTAAANALDDYEEGTWTPTVTPASGSITAYTSSGTYTKIGRTVVCQLRVTTTTIGTASGYLEVTNLPFSADLSTVSMFAGYGRDVSTGFTLSVEHYSALKALWQKYDGTFLGANGKIFAITLVYLV